MARGGLGQKGALMSATVPQTIFGRSVDRLAALRGARHFAAIPPSIAASELPIVEQPTGSPLGAFQRSASKATERFSISAV